MDLETIRSEVTAEQAKLLSAIWQHHRAQASRMPARLLHKSFGGKARVLELLSQLGGRIVFEVEESEFSVYGITFLGVLLSTDGPQVEQLISSYLAYAQAKALDETSRTHVSSQEVARDLDLSVQDVVTLGRALFLSPFQAGGSYGSEEWNARLPRDIEDLPQDLPSYTKAVAAEEYDRTVPVLESERQKVHLLTEQTRQPDKFFFVGDPQLKSQLDSDWKEVSATYTVEAWKACVVLCGAVLEGVLLDAIRPREEEAVAALKTAAPQRDLPPLDRWDLVDLVDAAAYVKLIGQGALHLGHALRLHRNLVHLGRQISDGIEVTKAEADISISTVERCIRELTSHVPSG
jgi:hypothetical protein